MHDNCPGHCEIVTDDKDCSRCVCAGIGIIKLIWYP